MLEMTAGEGAAPRKPGTDRRNVVGYTICETRGEAVERFVAKTREENPGYVIKGVSCIEVDRADLEQALRPAANDAAMRLEHKPDAKDRVDKYSAGNIDCLNKAKPGEPMWIMIGRDPVYEEAVEGWAAAREAAIADGRIPDTAHEWCHIETARRYARAGWRNRS